MSNITKEIDQVADEMEKSTQTSADLIKAQIIELGPEGLKKAVANMSSEQKELLSEVLDDMAKAAALDERIMSQSSAYETTPDGDQFENTSKEGFDAPDERVMDHSSDQHRNQGGVPLPGWDGQMIKSVMTRMVERKMEKSACVDKVVENTGFEKSAIEGIWDEMVKAQSYKYDDGTKGSDNPEADQVDMPKDMKSEEKAKKGKEEDRGGDSKTTADEGQKPPATMNKGCDSIATSDMKAGPEKLEKKDEKKKKPESGEASTTADGSNDDSAPEVKKSDVDEKWTLSKGRDPFKQRSHIDRTPRHYNVDAINAKEYVENLQKGRFAWETPDTLEKSQNSINDLLEKGLDMDQASLDVAINVAGRADEGAKLVKSFSDEDFMEIQKGTDLWEEDAETSEEG